MVPRGTKSQTLTMKNDQRRLGERSARAGEEELVATQTVATTERRFYENSIRRWNRLASLLLFFVSYSLLLQVFLILYFARAPYYCHYRVSVMRSHIFGAEERCSWSRAEMISARTKSNKRKRERERKKKRTLGSGRLLSRLRSCNPPAGKRVAPAAHFYIGTYFDLVHDDSTVNKSGID